VEISNLLLGILGLFLALFMMMQLVPMLLAHRMKGQQAPEMKAVLNDRQFQASRLLIYFWSPSCGMCRSVTPIIDELMKERDDVVSIDITQHMELARAYRIMGTPAIAIVEHGIIASVSLGARTRPQIIKMIEG
jgi:thioredoxin 1